MREGDSSPNMQRERLMGPMPMVLLLYSAVQRAAGQQCSERGGQQSKNTVRGEAAVQKHSAREGSSAQMQGEGTAVLKCSERGGSSPNIQRNERAAVHKCRERAVVQKCSEKGGSSPSMQ